MRCFNCQKYSHFKLFCNKDPICPKCGKADHGVTDCDSPMKLQWIPCC
jgi:hypothetical protein